MKDILGKDIDYRFAVAQVENREGWFPVSKKDIPPRLTGIYPLPSRRLAATDEYPDFFFEPQVYRQDGEHVFLPAGKYQVRYTRGPEYFTQATELHVPPGVDSIESTFKLRRWINLSKLGYYSADHHIHAAGCSHYESPEEGVRPKDMWRQILGEDLNVGAVLAWGPGWYHQKEFFTGGNVSHSFVYVISGAHAAHVIGGVVYLLIACYAVFKNRVSSSNMTVLEMCATYWHFLGVLWVYLYVFLILNR